MTNLLHSLSEQSQLTPEWVKSALCRDRNFNYPTFVNLSTEETEALFLRMAEIDLLCLEDPGLIKIAEHLRKEFLNHLTVFYHYQFKPQMPPHIRGQYPRMVNELLDHLWQTEQFRFDPWAVFLYENRDRMPRWPQSPDCRKSMPFGGSNSANALSMQICEAIICRSDGNDEAAFELLSHALYHVVTGLAYESAWKFCRVSTAPTMDEKLRVVFRCRYEVDCLKNKISPAREDFKQIIDGTLTYDYSSAYTLFSW